MPSNRIKPTVQASTLGSFENTLRRLARVPKAEADREEAKWKTMRKRLKKRGAAKGKRKRDG